MACDMFPVQLFSGWWPPPRVAASARKDLTASPSNLTTTTRTTGTRATTRTKKKTSKRVIYKPFHLFKMGPWRGPLPRPCRGSWTWVWYTWVQWRTLPGATGQTGAMNSLGLLRGPLTYSITLDWETLSDQQILGLEVLSIAVATSWKEKKHVINCKSNHFENLSVQWNTSRTGSLIFLTWGVIFFDQFWLSVFTQSHGQFQPPTSPGHSFTTSSFARPRPFSSPKGFTWRAGGPLGGNFGATLW